jgi:hypothetical protein
MLFLRFQKIKPVFNMQARALSEYELERGKQMPSKLHARTQTNFRGNQALSDKRLGLEIDLSQVLK